VEQGRNLSQVVHDHDGHTHIRGQISQHWKGKLIGVIVSGYDGDGAAALCGIKEVGGVTIAQKLDTAGQPDMPENRDGMYRFCSVA
jgi:chemotaxis response regulator CheB